MKTAELPNMTVADLEARAAAIRSSAKETRTAWKKQISNKDVMADLMARDNKFQEQSDQLDEVLAVLRERVVKSQDLSDEEMALSKQLADCYGVKGGLYRDWGRYCEAADMYRQGHVFEARVMEINPNETNSYCLVQEVVNQVLAAPEQLLLDHRLRDKIRTASSELARQIESVRRDDPWAWADFAVLTMLTQPREALGKWQTFKKLTSPGNFARSSTHEALLDVFQRLMPYLPPDDLSMWERYLSLIK